MKSHYIRCTVLCCALGVTACATPPTQEQTGTVVGGVLGGVLGSQVGGGDGRTAATIAGSLAGAFIGGAIGRSMDETDRLKVARTLETERTGSSAHWRNPDSGNQYTVTPTRTYETAGTPCREYVVDGTVGGRKEKIYGTACRQADGTWRTANR